MADKKKLTDEDLKAIVASAIDACVGRYDDELRAQQAQAMDYYYGEPFGNEVDDRSQVMTRDVLEVVEWMMPQLIESFIARDYICEFQPVGPEDEDTARLVTATIQALLSPRALFMYTSGARHAPLSTE